MKKTATGFAFLTILTVSFFHLLAFKTNPISKETPQESFERFFYSTLVHSNYVCHYPVDRIPKESMYKGIIRLCNGLNIDTTGIYLKVQNAGKTPWMNNYDYDHLLSSESEYDSLVSHYRDSLGLEPGFGGYYSNDFPIELFAITPPIWISDYVVAMHIVVIESSGNRRPALYFFAKVQDMDIWTSLDVIPYGQ